MQHMSFFDFAFIAMLTATFMIRMPHHYKNEVAAGKNSKVGVLDKLNFLLVFTGSTTLPVLYLFSPWFNFADYKLNFYAGCIGVFVAVFGLWLFWRSHADLGKQFSPMLEIKSDHKLITSGVYKRIRHPMYSAVFLLTIAQLLLIGNWVVGPFYLLGFLSLYLCRINSEENLMLEVFGEEYSEYSKVTGRLLPVKI